MGSSHLIYNCIEFLPFGLINSILMVNTGNGSVGRNSNRIHSVGIAELLLLSQSRTSHTSLLVELVEEVLEGNRSQSLALPTHIYMLLCLNRLMQSVRITTARHNTSGKLINNQNLIVLYYIVLITEHQVVCPKSKNNIVLNLQILRICQVFNMEEFLNLADTILCQVYDLILFIYNKVSSFLNVLPHNGVHLGKFTGSLTAHQLMSQHIADLVQLGRFAALTRNNQRCSRLVNQYRVHLVDNGIFQIAQNHLFLINSHVIAQVVKAQLIVGYISNITVICCFTLLRGHGV